MDDAAAKRMVKELIGKSINHWRLVDYISHGKSAVVFKGKHQKQEAAIKVFDRDLVDRFNKETQLKRINRELSLKDKEHTYLVKILDGGECYNTGLLFIAMEHIAAPNLESVLDSVPRDNIRQVIKQVACAALYLESLGLCHRDIKPSNLAISSDFQTTKLLDLGVLKPIGISDLTDEIKAHFIGTLRYSPPEFLIREEEDTIDGWRAVTFYQLGALLHDLIMKRPIFMENTDPYAKLVDAVKYTIPRVKACDVDTDLVHLAQMFLIKNPEKRLKLVSWENFFVDKPKNVSLDDVKTRVKQRCEMVQSSEVENILQSKERQNRGFEKFTMQVLDDVEMIFRNHCINNSCFPPVMISKTIDKTNGNNQLIVAFEPSVSKQLRSTLYITVDMEIIDLDTATILINYLVVMSSKGSELPQSDKNSYHCLYKGVYEKEAIEGKIVELLYLAFDMAQQRDVMGDKSIAVIEPFEELRS